MNISIISSCNNNCEYCFQKDYHKEKKMLSFEEIEDIIQWGISDGSVGILGGEPTLHPDIVKIMCRVKDFTPNTYIMTNLLCKREVLEELIEIKGLQFLVNSTCRDELKDLFYDNFRFLYSKKEFLKENGIQIFLGITLINDEECDKPYLENFFNILDLFPDLISIVRIGLATPFLGRKFELKNYQDSAGYFINKVLTDYPDIKIGFDCPSNNCQIPPKLMAECLDNPRILRFRLICDNPVLEVLVDKSLKYCFSCPDDFMSVDSYKRFPNAFFARNWYRRKISEYMTSNGFQCHKTKEECTNLVCAGVCPAINEHLRREFSEKENSA